MAMPDQEPMKDIALQKNIARRQERKIWNPQEKASLAVTIGRVFDLQKQYGKTTSQLENLVEGFCWALKPYSLDRIIDAFGEYILTHADMPTPYDIRQIIDPVEKPWTPDRSYYITLKKLFDNEGAFGLTTDEMEYIQKYENHMLKASRR